MNARFKVGDRVRVRCALHLSGRVVAVDEREGQTLYRIKARHQWTTWADQHVDLEPLALVGEDLP